VAQYNCGVGLCSWLIEVNASPSLTASSKEDYDLKCRLLDDVLNVIDLENRYRPHPRPTQQPSTRLLVSFPSFWANACKAVCPMLSGRCLSVLSCLSLCLSVCDVGVLWPNCWMDEDETWYAGTGRPRPRPHCVTWASSSLTQRGTSSAPHLKFRRRLRLRLRPYNPRSMSIVAKRLNGSSRNLARSRPRPSPNCVKWGPSSPPPQGHSPQFSAMSVVAKRLDESRCSLLGTEVGLDPGRTVLDGDPTPLPTKGHSPQFSAHACCDQTAG